MVLVQVKIQQSDKQLIDAQKGGSLNEKLHALLSARETGAGSPDSCVRAVSIRPQTFPPVKEAADIFPGLETDFGKLDPCEMRDLQKTRCLRSAPNRTFEIDKEMCESCQFRGLNYPPDLGGVTPKEHNKIGRQLEMLERRRDIEQMKLEQEKEKTDRLPAKVYY